MREQRTGETCEKRGKRIRERLIGASADGQRLRSLAIRSDGLEHAPQMSGSDTHDDDQRDKQHDHVKQIHHLLRVQRDAEHLRERNALNAKRPLGQRLGEANDRHHHRTYADGGDGDIMAGKPPYGEGEHRGDKRRDHTCGGQRHQEGPMRLRGQNRGGIGTHGERSCHAQNRLACGAGNQRQSHGGDGIDGDLSAHAGQVVIEEERGGYECHGTDEITPPRQRDRPAASQERAGQRLGFDIGLRPKQTLRLHDEDDDQRAEGDEVMCTVSEQRDAERFHHTEHKTTDHGSRDGA